MTPIKVSTTYINPETDCEYLIEAVVTPGERGTRENGFQVEPDSDDHVEIQSITRIYENGTTLRYTLEIIEMRFSADDLKAIEQAVLEAAENPAEYED